MPSHVMQKYNGSLAELKDKLFMLGLEGVWLEEPYGVWRFKCDNGASCHWSSTKGTLWFDGPAPQKEGLLTKVGNALAL